MYMHVSVYLRIAVCICVYVLWIFVYLICFNVRVLCVCESIYTHEWEFSRTPLRHVMHPGSVHVTNISELCATYYNISHDEYVSTTCFQISKNTFKTYQLRLSFDLLTWFQENSSILSRKSVTTFQRLIEMTHTHKHNSLRLSPDLVCRWPNIARVLN